MFYVTLPCSMPVCITDSCPIENIKNGIISYMKRYNGINVLRYRFLFHITAVYFFMSIYCLSIFIFTII